MEIERQGCITHIGNSDSGLIISNTDGFINVVKTNGDDVDFDAYWTLSDVDRMNVLSSPNTSIEDKIAALVAVGLSPDEIKSSLKNNADFRALLKDGDETFDTVYAEQKENVDTANNIIDTVTTILEVGSFVAESATGVVALRELVAKYGLKEATKIIAKETGKDIKEVGKSVQGLLNTNLSKNIRAYIDDIQQLTGRKLDDRQKDLLKENLREYEYTRLTPNQVEINRKDFNNKRVDLIQQWELETGQVWPIDPRSGNKYDAHHIIENKFGGPNEWWNIHPARGGSNTSGLNEHQGGIHRASGPAEAIFGR